LSITVASGCVVTENLIYIKKTPILFVCLIKMKITDIDFSQFNFFDRIQICWFVLIGREIAFCEKVYQKPELVK
jgi:hypothetical protein